MIMKKLILILVLLGFISACDPVETYDRCQTSGNFSDVDCGLEALTGMLFGRACGVTIFGHIPCPQHR